MANETLQLHNTQTEHEVLSAVINDENIYTSLRSMLSEDLFTDHNSKILFSIITQFEQEGKTPNFSEAAMHLISKGVDVTMFLASGYQSFAVTRQKVDMLKDLSLKRNLYTLCVKGMNIATNPASDTSEFQKLLSEFGEMTKDETSDIISFSSTVKALQNSIAKRMDGTGEKGIYTGLRIFDARLGFHTGDLVIIAGETSMGKSSLATTIAHNMAVEQTPIAYYSLEMGANQLTARIVARDTQISSSRILYDKFNDYEYSKFYDSTNTMSRLPIYFDERSKTSFTKMCNSIRAMVRKFKIKVAFIDYLQILVNSSQRDNREQLIGDMARELKRIAVECNVCIVALSQLSRDQNNHEPTISRLRGSGQIEEAADMVVLIYRPSVYGIERYGNGISTEGTAQISIAKGRNIGLAKEIVKFDGNLTFFSDIDEHVSIAEPAKSEQEPWNRKEEYQNLPF